MNPSARLEPKVEVSRPAADVVRVCLAGDWRRAGVPAIAEVEALLRGNEHPRVLEFETGDLRHWDSGVLAFAARCEELGRERGVEVRLNTLPEGLQRLLRLARAVPEAREARRGSRRAGVVARVGQAAQFAGDYVVDFVTFLGESLQALGRLLRGRSAMRWGDALHVMQTTGPQALGIVALINFLVGLILAFVGAVQLARFGATMYVADLVAVATVREMGCLMTAIILCGRTGAAFAAQLGTMRVNEEVDALATFGFPPVDFLVLPRLLGLGLMMPLLCVFADLIAMGGGFVVATGLLDLSSVDYVHRTLAAITWESFLLGVFKGAVFGLWVALVGCWRGLRCGHTAAAVGEATTSAVVLGITGIIALDGVFAVVTKILEI
jgi:phospholipid/cholesterol/gamma-HCH transport system permease protein